MKPTNGDETQDNVSDKANQDSEPPSPPDGGDSRPRRARPLRDGGDDDVTIEYLKTSPNDSTDESPTAYNTVLEKMFNKRERESGRAATDETVCDYKLPPELEAVTQKGGGKRKTLFVLSMVILLGSGWFLVDYWTKSQDLIYEFSWKSLSEPIKIKHRKPIKKTPAKNATAILDQAKQAFKKKDFKKSLSLFTKADALLDLSPRELISIGECHDSLNQPDEAAAFYDRALEKGCDNLSLFLRQAEWHMRRKASDKAIRLLLKAKSIYQFDSNVHEKLGEFYCAVGEEEQALEAFRHCQTSTLELANLKRYARLLESAGDTETAKQLYLLGARDHDDLTCSLKAIDCIQDPNEKIIFLSTALQKLGKDKVRWETATLSLAENLLLVGKKKKAFNTLKDLDVAKVGSTRLPRIVNALVECASADHLSKTIPIIIDRYGASLSEHENLQAKLCLAGHYNLCVDLYKKWAEKNDDDARACYLYARIIENPISANINYRKAIRLRPSFYLAHLEAGKLHLADGESEEAFRLFHRCSRLRPAWIEPVRLIALNKLQNEKNVERQVEALNEYQQFLDDLTIDEHKKHRKLVNVALQAPAPGLAERYLEILREKTNNGDDEDYRFLKLKNDVIEGKAENDAFSSLDDPDVKRLQLIHILNTEKAENVLALPESDNPNVNFWKCFIRWRDNLGDWRSLAERLSGKASQPTVFAIAGALWLDKITIPQAKRLGALLNPEAYPLLHFIIAEKYRKAGEKIKAKIHYIKALKNERSVYHGLVKRYFQISGHAGPDSSSKEI